MAETTTTEEKQVGKKYDKFKIKHIPKLLVKTGKQWIEDDPFRLAAVVAYYALLSLPGLLVVVINTVGFFWGTEIVTGQLTSTIESAIGSDAAKTVTSILENATTSEDNLLATLLAIGVLVFGATGVFFHLQISLNEIWQIKPNPKSGFVRMLINRLISFAFVLIVGFLLLIFFVISALLAILQEFIRESLPDVLLIVAYLLNLALSLGVITLLFALIFKYLPDAKIWWKSVWGGAFITAILFTIGKELLGLYFGEANPGSTYGAAGSLVLILLWVSYSSLILFFGAEFTWVFARRYGHDIRPADHAVLVKVQKVEQVKRVQSVSSDD